MKLENLVIASLLTIVIGFMASGQPNKGIKNISGQGWSSNSLLKSKESPKPSFVAMSFIFPDLG